MRIRNDIVWSALLELIQSGEITTMPCPATSSPSVGDVICFETLEQVSGESADNWVYVEVRGVYDHYARGAGTPTPGLKLLIFHVIEKLEDLTIE